MSQLALFAGKRQRGVKPPPVSEFRTQCALADTLDRWLAPGWMYTHLPFGEHRTEMTGARLKRMGTKRGWPDFVFVGQGRELIFLELKNRINKLTNEQVMVAQHLKECGFTFLLANSYESAVTQLKTYGVLQSIHVQ